MYGSFDLLADMTVIEFGDSLPGSVCAYHLALLGARVLLAEPAEGCWLRRAGSRIDGEPGPLFTAFGRGKSSVNLDEFIRRGVTGDVDVVLRPSRGGMAREELPESCKIGLPSGPLVVDFREADGTFMTETAAQAAFGMSAYLGAVDRPPLRVGFEAITYSAGVLATQAVLAALPYREKHGVGQRINVPISRVAANVLNNVITGSIAPDQDVGFSRSWASAPYVGVPAADGELDFLFYGPQSESAWSTFCTKIGCTELITDPRFPTSFARTYKGGELAAALAPATIRFRRDDLLQLIRECGAMAVPRLSASEAAASEQAAANDMAIRRNGAGVVIASPWQINGKRSGALAYPELAGWRRTESAAGGDENATA